MACKWITAIRNARGLTFEQAFQAYQAREVQRRPWNSLLISLHKLSKGALPPKVWCRDELTCRSAYSQSLLVLYFFEAVRGNNELDNTTRDVLRALFRLFSLYTIDVEAREFQTSGAVTNDILERLPDRILELMQYIRPHAVRLVDSFALPDYLLDRYVLGEATAGVSVLTFLQCSRAIRWSCIRGLVPPSTRYQPSQ